MNKPMIARERRRTKRVVCAATVRFQSGREIGGDATLQDIDHGGLGITSAYPLERGQRVLLEVSDPACGDRTIELKGQVAWCEQFGEAYCAGIRIYHDETDARVVLCALMCASLKKQAAIASLRDRHFIYAEWKLAKLAATEEPNGIWSKRPSPKDAMRRTLAPGH